MYTVNNMEKKSMSKFNVGDVVRCVMGYGKYLLQGSLYKVTSVTDGYVYLGPVSPGSTAPLSGGGWDARRFVLEQPQKGWYGNLGPVVSVSVSKPERFILILEEGGELKPAPTPKVYTSEKQAKFVAQEMSQKHPGAHYIVWKAFGESYTPRSETSFRAY
jgi:hypothetical protein